MTIFRNQTFQPIWYSLNEILIFLGLTVTWFYHAILNLNFKERKKRLFLIILLGIYFTLLQLIEYVESPFTIADLIYGSTFFITICFHGLHVIIGIVFLIACFNRIRSLHFSNSHHFDFEAAAWYRHFVDVKPFNIFFRWINVN